jgi:hypothetical protein
MRRSTPVLVLISLLGLILTWDLVAASPRDRRFFNARYGVGVDAPPGWTLSQHTGYPNILVVLLHPNGGRISVSAALTPALDAQSLAEQNRHGLEAQHFVIARAGAGPRGGVQVDAHSNTRSDLLRQLYLVRPIGKGIRQAIVLTLVARSETLTALAPGFDWAVAHLALEPPTGTDDVRPDAGPGQEASAGQQSPDQNHR